jgi:hypothetical protein
VRASIVVASFSGEEVLRSCLDSLERHHGDAEVIVPWAADPEALARVQSSYAWAELVGAERATSVFQLRSVGLSRARGDVTLLLEDHCEVGPGWLEALRGSVEREHGFAGGPVESGSRSLAGFALHVVEYGALMPPVVDSRAILAVNAAYDRRALDACATVWADGFFDNEVHDALRAAGHVPRMIAGATVRTHLAWPLTRALRHLFQGGARFGAYRSQRSRRAERVLRVLAAPLVPALLLARLVGRVAIRRPRALPRLVFALPSVSLLVAAWGAGELAGQLGRADEAG